MLKGILPLFLALAGVVNARPSIAVLPFEERIIVRGLRSDAAALRLAVEALVAKDGRFRLVSPPPQPPRPPPDAASELIALRTSGIDFFIDADIFSGAGKTSFAFYFIDSAAETAVKSKAVTLHSRADVSLRRVSGQLKTFMESDEIGHALAAHWAAFLPRYAVGDMGPAGGVIFFVKPTDSEGWRYMEAAPYDLSAVCAWEEAAARCDVFVEGGAYDWYLPSKDELELLYRTLAVRALGNLSENSYWSSTSSGENTAWFQRFRDGRQFFNGHKSSIFAVRAIRKFE